MDRTNHRAQTAWHQLFYQRHWAIVSQDAIQLVKNFLYDGHLPDYLNDTNVVLIPKKKNPITLRDLRPISLCNVLIKIITKVLANRMKTMLNGVVAENQSAFIAGRLITDNIMVGYEMIHYLHFLSTSKFFAFNCSNEICCCDQIDPYPIH